jgi:dienelactone hydrolase
MGKFSRRTLLAGSAVMAKAQTSSYTGALDNAPTSVELNRFDPVLWTRERWKEMPRRMRFQAMTRKDALAWQKRLRGKVTELLGGFPSNRGPLEAQVIEQRDFGRYTREKVVFTSRPGVGVLGYLLVPKGVARPPVAVCVPGHGRGVDDIVGIDSEGKDRTNKSGYQHDFAIQMVEQGVAAFAIEPMAFGCRRDPVSRKKGLGNSACQPTAGAALLFGETMIGWRAWDVMRSIDYLETRKEVNADRVGCLGISGGGTCTLFTTALEPRIKAALVSGYLCTFRDSILSLSHCIDNYVPGILQWAEMSDVAGLIAPRPLFAESGEKDTIFPLAAAQEAFREVQRVYEVFGAKDAAHHEIFPAEHIFHGVLGVPGLARALAVG